MKFYPSTIVTFILAVIIGMMVYTSRVFPFQVGLHVWFAGVIGLGASIVVLVQDIRQAMKGGAEITGTGMALDVKAEYNMSGSEVRRRIARIALWFLAVYLMTWLVGFKIAIGVFFLTYLPIEARTRWYKTLLLTACAVAFLIYFDIFLQAFWPEGVLKEWLPWLL